MIKPSKKAVNKKKLKSLEWTDEAIAQCSALNGGSANAASTMSLQFDVDGQQAEDFTTMESKIARVQARKKEAREREMRFKKLRHSQDNISFESPALSGSDASKARTLASALNAHFERVFANKEIDSEPLSIRFPLYMYDSSSFDEVLSFACGRGVCLLNHLETLPAAASPLGRWYPCDVIEVSESDVLMIAQGQVAEVTMRVPKLLVCLLAHSFETYVKRIYDALNRRNRCVSLMKYIIFVRSMPMNRRITSTMDVAQRQRIFQKASSSTSLRHLQRSVADEQIDEAQREFEFVMNLLLFECNLLAKKNVAFAASLHLPQRLQTEQSKSAKAPQCGLIVLPAHNMKAKLSLHRSSSYINSPAAIAALHCVLRENEIILAQRVIKVSYTKPFTLEKFDRYLNEQLILAIRTIKQDWPVRTGQAVRAAILRSQQSSDPSCVVYDVGLRNIFEFENTQNGIRSLLERMNFMMSDVLKEGLSNSLLAFTDLVENFCSCEVQVHDIRHIDVIIPETSFYRKQALPPLFSIAFRITTEDKVLNQEDIDKNKKEIAAWSKTKEAANGEKCPIAIVPAVVGKTFEYTQNPDDFKEAMLKAFRLIVTDFLDVPHIQKYVLEKVYFPVTKFIPSISLELDWVRNALERVDRAVTNALHPLHSYLKFFQKYESVLNIDINSYINNKIPVALKDSESTEIELPVAVNLTQVRALIDEHLDSIREIEESLPIHPIACGLFLVEVVSVRVLLLEKHRSVIRAVLSQHASRCSIISEYLDDEFKKIAKKLQDRPENIEKLVEQEEYITALPTTINTLQACSQDMMASYDLLDIYRFKIDLDSGSQRWNVFGAPAKVYLKCTEVQENNVAVKRRFRDEMLGEQASFLKTLHELDHAVAGLENLVDLSDVVNIAAKVKEVEMRLNNAQTKARLFNSRETLFEQDITDYEELNRIARNFEPYSNLWQTAKEWLELADGWRRSLFINLNAEEVERSVDKFNVAINKAARYFQKTDLKHQSAIANKIKGQVAEFVPEVPLIVTLRNPGMRDRHWEKIAHELNVDILPIDNFTTEQIISMNLKDSLETIQKIGESAAKEFQIEQALDKMEREWENMNLNISHYKETGTGVLKGVDDINVVLDEQITMTQVRCYSLFLCLFS
eukprot:scaffold958_cov229-Ochromonas_danica.AAC.10